MHNLSTSTPPPTPPTPLLNSDHQVESQGTFSSPPDRISDPFKKRRQRKKRALTQAEHRKIYRARQLEDERNQVHKLILRPQVGPQEEFLSRGEDEVLFGGSKGGGKSYALILDSLRYVSISGYKAIIFRRTYPKLAELIDRAHQIFPHLGAKWHAKDYKWVFPSGASIRFAHCQTEEDKYIYQGHEYHFMGFDQLEEFTESMYLFLCTQMRNPPKGVQIAVRATANPGGIGHAWVYRRFMVDPVTNEEILPGTVIRERFILPFAVAKMRQGDTLVRSRVFIPATVYDNKILLENDPNYLATLMQLPEGERKALLEGDWHVFAGQYFKEWSAIRHVVAPFEIPRNWLRFRCIDFGSTAPFACYWGAVNEQGQVYWYREYYASGFNARQNAKKVKAMSTYIDENGQEVEENYVFSVIDPAVFSKTGQDYSIGEVMTDEGLTGLEPGGNDRLSGWQEFHWRLSWSDSTGKDPGMFFFSTCINAIRTVPGLIHDEKRPEDLNTDGEDHAADAIRYGIVRLRDSKAKAMPEAEAVNRTGFRFGVPIEAWVKAKEYAVNVNNPWSMW